jgi:uncharacterized membrane protein
MAVAQVSEKYGVFLDWRPNRSLDRGQRRLWLVLIAAPVLVVSAGFSGLGAWPVLPFAGLELSVLWWAFRLVGKHDEDYEILDVSRYEFCWERRECRRIERLAGNPEWAQLVWPAAGPARSMLLRYGGRSVAVGAQLCEQERLRLAQQMARVFQRHRK